MGIQLIEATKRIDNLKNRIKVGPPKAGSLIK
jgi:hypothetical protein